MHCVVTIRTMTGGQPGEMLFTFKAYGAATLAEVHDQIVRDGLIQGERYQSRPDGQGARRILGGVKTIIMRDAILSITEMSETLRDAQGRVVFDPAGARDA